MSRILVSHAYFYYFDRKQWKTGRPYPPLGTLYACSVLRNAGHEVHFFDNALEKSTTGFKRRLNEVEADYVVLYEDGFNYLTKMCLTNMRNAAFDMSAFAAENGIPVILSSSDSTDHYREYLEHGVRYVIAGEGEITLLELIDSIESKKEISGVEGLIFKSAKGIEKTEPRKVLRDLDALPLPAWDLVDMNRYRRIWMKKAGYFSLNIVTTRGCPYKCNWCAKPIYGNRYNSRSPGSVVREMKLLIEKYSVDHFWICDDIFGLKPNWVRQFADEMELNELKTRYKIQSRADLMIKGDTVQSLARSGMEEVWIGAESGSQKILDAMDKGITVQQIKQATKMVREHGKKICFFLQFGYLGEEMEDIDKTVDLMLSLMPDDIGISVSYPLPGTGFYDKVKADMNVKTNWTDSDDLDLMYSGTYNRKFYKKLHRHVHKLYRRKQGILYLKKPLNNWRKYRNLEFRSILLSLFYYGPLTLLSFPVDKRLQSI